MTELNEAFVTDNNLATEIDKGQLIGLKCLIGCEMVDPYYGWHERYALTIGRLAVNTVKLSKVKFDMFITSIGPQAYRHGDVVTGNKLIVGGKGAKNKFDIRYPIDYLNISPRTINTYAPSYKMEGPTDYPPSVSKVIRPVKIITGELATVTLGNMLGIGHYIEDPEFNIMPIIKDPDCNGKDFIKAVRKLNKVNKYY